MEQVLTSVIPDLTSARRRVQVLISKGELLIEPWTGGIDGLALARALHENLAGSDERLN